MWDEDHERKVLNALIEAGDRTKETKMFDADGNRIDRERWRFLVSSGEYGLVHRNQNNSMYVSTFWTGLSKSEFDAEEIFSTVVVHDPFRPHIESILYWDVEREASIGHEFTWNQVDYIYSDTVGLIRSKYRLSWIGERLHRMRMRRTSHFKELVEFSKRGE